MIFYFFLYVIRMNCCTYTNKVTLGTAPDSKQQIQRLVQGMWWLFGPKSHAQ